MSIRFRLNALIVAVSALGLGLLVAGLVLSAGPRIRAESESTMRLAKEFVETTIASLQGTEDPGARLKVLLGGLKELRHVHIYRSDEPVPEALLAEQLDWQGASAVPRWLAHMGRPIAAMEVPVIVNGKDFGTLVIAPRLADEAAEIWDSIINFTLGGAALAIAAALLISLTIARLLKPIGDVGNALQVLEQGRYAVKIPEGGPPEIAGICRKLNRLAATLDETVSDNKRLAQRLVRVQDEERKDLAHELHDEFGPYLFAARAAVSTLSADIKRGLSDKQKLLATCDTLVTHIETIQRMNRNVLHKLRPMGLEEYGLKAKLTSLLALLRESHPHVAIRLSVDEDLPVGDETSTLTIYRLAQEGLTNALRHADAARIDVAIRLAQSSEAPIAVRGRGGPVVHIAVVDDGRGLSSDARPSYGIAGMSERVWASGGEMHLTNPSAGGLRLDAWLPITAVDGKEMRDNLLTRA
ncbi:two-component system, NarL family, sensor histidine kinase UhpB [Hyphomicrobium sp. 1Nfss2.1]|uniref:histidine kinase n=1 Tax=Hyphomicrobium sp. 1Nfss2.1 TaxID=3413936 RepID=UPI003C7BB0C6